MELLKDYNCYILYHLGKANRVTDALSRKLSIAHLLVKEWMLLEEARNSEFKFEVGHLFSLMATLRIEPKVQAKIKALQSTDLEIQKILEGLAASLHDARSQRLVPFHLIDALRR